MSVHAPFDQVIAQAWLADGSGGPLYRADVGLRGARIAAIAPPGTLDAPRRIEAEGLVLAPGFIDVHTHDDRAVLDAPQMLPKLSQGVTTVVSGNCGISLAPWRAGTAAPPAPLTLLGAAADYRFERFADYLDAVDAARPAVNVAALVGHSTLRVAELGADLQRPASAAEIARMQTRLDDAMQAGAFGLSSGLFYKTSAAAPNAEVIALARVVTRHGGLYTSHIRDEYDRVLEALDEAIDAGEAARLPVLLSHHKCAGPANWGRSLQTLALIERRRSASRHGVAIDAYPYAAGSTVINPELVDGVIRILITGSEPHPEMSGRELAEIAAEWGLTQRAAAERLMPGGAVYFQMEEADVQRVLAYPHTLIGSDGLPHDRHPHPRLWGAFPRFLGHYCRDLKLLPLAEGVRKMTALSAATFGLRARGRIDVGAYADLVLFDAEAIADRATYAQPMLAAAGIHSVWVNGALALHEGAVTGARAGRALRRADERFSPSPERESSDVVS